MGMRAAACSATQILASGRHIYVTSVDLPTLFERPPGADACRSSKRRSPPPGSLGLNASRSAAPSRAQPMTGGCRRSMAPMSTMFRPTDDTQALTRLWGRCRRRIDVAKVVLARYPPPPPIPPGQCEPASANSVPILHCHLSITSPKCVPLLSVVVGAQVLPTYMVYDFLALDGASAASSAHMRTAPHFRTRPAIMALVCLSGWIERLGSFARLPAFDQDPII